MQWIWLLPSLAFGVYLFLSTGQATGLIFGGFSLVAMVVAAIIKFNKVPTDDRAPVRVGKTGNGKPRYAIGNQVLPNQQWRWQPQSLDKVYSHLEAQNSRHSAQLSLKERVSGSLAASGGSLSGWLGFAGSSEVVLDLPNEGAHAIILGATGAGKSQLLQTWLVSLCQGYQPAQLQLWLMDFKGGSALNGFSKLPWAVAYATDLDGNAPNVLKALAEELHRREQHLATWKASRLEDLPTDQGLPRLIIAIDEAQVLLGDMANHATILSVAARGRSLGMHLLLTSQSLNGIPRGLLTNLTARFAVGKSDPVDLAQLGYSRQSSPVVSEGLPEGNQVEAGDEWANAVLITPKRQLNFLFPSAGLVASSRLQQPQNLSPSIEIAQVAEPFGHQKVSKTSNSVVIPKNTFDFGFGFENQR